MTYSSNWQKTSLTIGRWTADMGKGIIQARGITADLAKYFRDHVGQEVFLKDLENEFPSFTKLQIQGNINNLNRTNSAVQVETLLKGQSWIYRPGANGKPGAVTAKRMFEEVAVTKAGALIIQDESGNLYRATELE